MSTSRRLSTNLIACTPTHLRRAVPPHTQRARYGFRSLLLRLLPPAHPSCADTRIDPLTQMRLLALRARGTFLATLPRCSTLVKTSPVVDLSTPSLLCDFIFCSLSVPASQFLLYATHSHPNSSSDMVHLNPFVDPCRRHSSFPYPLSSPNTHTPPPHTPLTSTT